VACRGARRGASGILRPKECVFTDEFYCRYNELLDFAGAIVGQWACGKGEIDCFVREPRWGFEFLRHGDRLAEHLSRFHTNGMYGQDIQSGALADWLVVDCRTSMPQKQCTSIFFTSSFPFICSAARFTNPILQTPMSRNWSARYSWRGTIRFFSIA
jgi:hypothetical protein